VRNGTEFRIADTFTDSLARPTGDEQKAVRTTAFDLQLNPAPKRSQPVGAGGGEGTQGGEAPSPEFEAMVLCCDPLAIALTAAASARRRTAV